MEISTYGYSDIGGRRVNEDSYNIVLGKDNSECAAIVADGLGGHGMGQQASQTVVRSLSQISRPKQEDVLAAMERADAEIKKRRENEFQMKTTAVCLYLYDNTALWAHIGDSRLYHFYNCELCDFTLDHSLSQVAVALGEIERRDIPKHSDRSKVLRVIGDDELNPDFKNIVLKKGFHAFLLCSDGFWEYLQEDEILLDLHKSRTAKDWIVNLRSRVVKRIKDDNDNNTAVAVYVNVGGD